MSDFYCSQKFYWLSVNAEKRNISSCCAAFPESINMKWLKDNPGQMFNTPTLQQERIDMLNNIPVSSCETNCWLPERQGLPSRRTASSSNTKTHLEINAIPKILNLSVGSDCNLTCSYCCKQYSTAWLKDIEKNGPYLNSERFNINVSDKIVLKLGQKTIKNSSTYQSILKEIKSYTNLDRIEISGGEPFLYNGLPDLLKDFSGEITVFSGLGVNQERFSRVLNALPLDRTTITISAENVGSAYEFNRFGNSYENFLANLNIVISSGVKYRFSTVLANLTIFGFKEFLDKFGSENMILNICSDPSFLSASMIDDESKNILAKNDYGIFNTTVQNTLNIESDKTQLNNLRIYLKKFSDNRNIKLDIFPNSFLKWVNIT